MAVFETIILFEESKKAETVVKSGYQLVLGFPCLKDVSVENCSGIRYIFPNFTVTTLEKLERLYIGYCEERKWFPTKKVVEQM